MFRLGIDTFARMKRMRKILIAAIILSGTACKPLTDVQSTADAAEKSHSITFCTLRAAGNNGLIQKIDLIETSQVGGTMKKNPRENYLFPVQVTLENPSGLVSDSFLIPNPLIEVLEYPGDNNQLAIKTNRLDSALFFIRFPDRTGDEFIRFASTQADSLKFNIKIKLDK